MLIFLSNAKFWKLVAGINIVGGQKDQHISKRVPIEKSSPEIHVQSIDCYHEHLFLENLMKEELQN